MMPLRGLSAASTIAGHAPTKTVQRLVRGQYCNQYKASQNKWTEVFLLVLDEYLTSQVCSRCGAHSLEKLNGMHKVLKCTNPACGVVVDRDVNAARNMCAIAVALLFEAASCTQLVPTFRQLKRRTICAPGERDALEAAFGH